MSEWIPVSERLPEEDRNVLVAGPRRNDVRNGYWQLTLAMMDGVWVMDDIGWVELCYIVAVALVLLSFCPALK